MSLNRLIWCSSPTLVFLVSSLGISSSFAHRSDGDTSLSRMDECVEMHHAGQAGLTDCEQYVDPQIKIFWQILFCSEKSYL